MRRTLLVGSLCAVIAASIAAWADGLTVPLIIPATTCSSQFIRSVAAATGVGTCASIASADLSNLAGQYPGVSTNTAATAGNVGEIITATATAASVSLTTGTAKTITSISLTAGEWDVTGIIDYGTSGTTTVSSLYCFISLTNNTTDATEGAGTAYSFTGTGQVINSQAILSCPTVRKSFSGTTSVFLVGFSSFGTSTLSAGGFIRATRIH